MVTFTPTTEYTFEVYFLHTSKQFRVALNIKIQIENLKVRFQKEKNLITTRSPTLTLLPPIPFPKH